MLDHGLLDGVERAGADVAEDDADGADGQRGQAGVSVARAGRGQVAGNPGRLQRDAGLGRHGGWAVRVCGHGMAAGRRRIGGWYPHPARGCDAGGRRRSHVR
ncbi:MAG: hypothetical protein ACK55I_30430, partial [bacterium]